MSMQLLRLPRLVTYQLRSLSGHELTYFVLETLPFYANLNLLDLFADRHTAQKLPAHFRQKRVGQNMIDISGTAFHFGAACRDRLD